MSYSMSNWLFMGFGLCFRMATVLALSSATSANGDEVGTAFLARFNYLWNLECKEEYYTKALAFSQQIESGEIENGERAYFMLKHILSRDTSPAGSYSPDLHAMKHLSLYLMLAPESKVAWHADVARVVSRVLGGVRDEMIADYEPLPVFLNIMPQDVEGFAFAGMRPEAIDDPAARERYEKALKQNAMNARMNQRQRSLGRIERILKWSVIQYLREARRSGVLAEDILDECILLARLVDAEVMIVLNGGGSR